MSNDTEQLVQRAGRGDTAATQQLFARYRERLKRMVAVRIDPRLSSRLDSSDVVQEALTLAAQRFDEYYRSAEIPFYPWLRRLTYERLIQLHRHHVHRHKRSVAREAACVLPLSSRSAVQLVDQLVAQGPSPCGRLIRQEQFSAALRALDRLPHNYREVLVLRHLEQLSIEEAAAVLGVSTGTIKSRHFRAIARLSEELGRTGK